TVPLPDSLPILPLPLRRLLPIAGPMSPPDAVTDLIRARLVPFSRPHFLSAGELTPPAVADLLDLAEAFVELNRQGPKKLDLLKGRTIVNLFFEASTRTQSSFELAGKRLGADVVHMSPRTSSVTQGEALIDTAVTLAAVNPDSLVARHAACGAPALLAQ